MALFSSKSSSSESSCSSYSITRHYYTQNQRFEQSLDVYTPLDKRCSNNNSNNKNVIIVLVMGSGWLGHVWWISRGTNWWNASGPQTICGELGYDCISVRHAGGFYQVPRIERVLPVWITLLSSMIAHYYYYYYASLSPENDDESSMKSFSAAAAMIMAMTSRTIIIVSVFIGLTVLYLFLLWQGQGSAQMDDMVQDVADALQYIRGELLLLGADDDSTTTTATAATTAVPIVLGGYSSGAHVVATFLTSELGPASSSSSHSNQYPDIVGILYLSGVLSLTNNKCWAMNLITLTVFGKWANDLPSPLFLGGTTPTTTTTTTTTTTATKTSPSPPPPIHLKHLLIGCHKEIFGIPLFDGAFCAQQYGEWISRLARKKQQNEKEQVHQQQENDDDDNNDNTTMEDPARCVLVQSNHWSVLASQGLVQALDDNLPWLMLPSSITATATATASRRTPSKPMVSRLSGAISESSFTTSTSTSTSATTTTTTTTSDSGTRSEESNAVAA